MKNHIHNQDNNDDDDATETTSNVNSAMQNNFRVRMAELLKNNDNSNNGQISNKSSVINSFKSFLNPIKEQDLAYLLWLGVVLLFYLYNLISISFRYAFENQITNSSQHNSSQLISEYSVYWRLIDYMADIIYLIDIFAVKIRLKYLENGLWVTNRKMMALKYFKSLNCWVKNCFFLVNWCYINFLNYKD